MYTKRLSGISRYRFASTASSATVLFVAFGFYGYASTFGRGGSQASSYELGATFLSSNGLHRGADVVLAGVPVGTVTEAALDAQTMLSRVNFVVQSDIRLPIDSRLSIGSSTLTSGNALIISPGKSPKTYVNGSTVAQTCEPTSLEQQISQYIFGAAGASSECSS